VNDTTSSALQLLLALAAFVLLPGLIRADGSALLSTELSGHGQTEADAQQDAMNQARDRIVALLRERRPDLRWEPSENYLRESHLTHLLKHVPNEPSELIGPHHSVTLRVDVREADLRRMLQQDRLQRRHLLTAKIVAALVALLAVLAAFFRLEDVTRGYYTKPLRGALSVCVMIIGAGLWVVL
jgi:hypothetical protein